MTVGSIPAGCFFIDRPLISAILKSEILPAETTMKAGENRKLAIGNRKSVLPPSSSGLGYQVLILETGVRLPLGVFFVFGKK